MINLLISLMPTFPSHLETVPSGEASEIPWQQLWQIVVYIFGLSGTIKM